MKKHLKIICAVLSILILLPVCSYAEDFSVNEAATSVYEIMGEHIGNPTGDGVVRPKIEFYKIDEDDLKEAEAAYVTGVSVLASDGEESMPEYYGRSALSKLDNSDVLLYAYDSLAAGIKAVNEQVYVYDGDAPITLAEVKLVVEILTADHPEYFWFTGGYKMYGSDENDIHYIVPEYKLNNSETDKDEIDAADAVFQAKVNQVITEMEKEAAVGSTKYESDYNKALWLHDKVAEIVTYEFGPNNQTPYGALIDGKAVCAGYSSLYEYLLQRSGIQALSVTGTSVDSSGKSENHEWTLFWLDDACVYADVTWDDQKAGIFHLYFARSLSAMSVEHTLDEDYAELIPQCTSEKCTTSGYFDVTKPQNKISGDIEASAVRAALVENKGKGVWIAELYDPTGTKLLEWLKSNASSLTQGLPAGSYSISYRYTGNIGVGREFRVTVSFKYLNAEIDKENNEYSINARLVSTDTYSSPKLCIKFYNSDMEVVDILLNPISGTSDSFTGTLPEGSNGYEAFLWEWGTSGLRAVCETVSKSKN